MKSYILYLISMILSIYSQNLFGQVVCEQSKKEIMLKCGTKVSVYAGETWDDGSVPYYYLPAKIRISEKDEKPEFMFLDYSDGGNPEDKGALMHMLITWGLSSSETNEIEQKLREEVDSLAFLAGSLNIIADSANSFEINAKNDLGKILGNSLKSSGSAPVTPGSKMALSFHLKGENANTIAEAMNNRKEFKDVVFSMLYAYDLNNCSGSFIAPQTYELVLESDLYTLLKSIKNP